MRIDGETVAWLVLAVILGWLAIKGIGLAIRADREAGRALHDGE